MKLKAFLLILFLIMNFSSLFAQNTYEDMWKNVEKLQDDDKPKSVIDEAQKIYDKAFKEGNFPNMLKSKICITEMQCDLDPELFAGDEYEKLLTDIEQDKSLSTEERTARLALTHFMLASAYNSMWDSYVHDYDQETREQFPKKAKKHALATLDNMGTLSLCNAEQYVPLVLIREDSRFYNHDLLSLLLNEVTKNKVAKITEEEKILLFTKAIDIYRKKGNINAVALLSLSHFSLLYNSKTKSVRITTEQYRNLLKNLLDEVQGYELEIDVEAEYAKYVSSDPDELLLYARKCIEKWKDNPRNVSFKQTEKEYMRGKINISAEKNILANQRFNIKIEYRNATSATLTIREYSGRDNNRNLTEKGKIISTHKLALPLDEKNQQRKEQNLPTSGENIDTLCLAPGHYTITIESEGEKRSIEVRITSIRAVTMALPDNKSIKIIILDNTTGRPVPNATVMAFNSWDHKEGEKPNKKFETDKNGIVIINNYHEERFNSLIATRKYSDYGTPREDCTESFYPRTSYEHHEEKANTILTAFTDRSIYRPGQTIHTSAIAYWQHGDTVMAVSNKKIHVEINNPEYQRIFSDDVMTNEQGTISFEFKLPDECKLGRYYVSIKDGWNSSSADFHVEEYKRPTFEVEFDEKQKETKHALGDKVQVIGSAIMFSGVPNQSAKVHYAISWAEEHKWFYRYNWEELTEDDTATDSEGSFIIDFEADIPEIVSCDSIAFRIKAEVTDMSGEMQIGEFIFKVKNPNFKEIIKEKDHDDASVYKDIFRLSAQEISENTDVTATFKAQEKDALVYYYVLSKDKYEVLDSKVLATNNDELKFKIQYRKQWGEGVSVGVFYVRNGHLYHSSSNIAYVRPQKKLTLAWKTFRDNLIPGQKEEWTLTVKDYKGNTVSGAELMAVMYDASLDNIYPHDWDFHVSFNRFIPNAFAVSTAENPNIDLWVYMRDHFYQNKSRIFDLLHSFEHQRWHRLKPIPFAMVCESAPMAMKRVSNELVADRAEITKEDTEAIQSRGNGIEQSDNTKQPLRTNLEELAFFYPHLSTDAQGEAHIAFTLPDCLTEWKFMGIVHTKDLDYGTIAATATAKKDFMVQPNMPRFLRAGDKAVIIGKVINLTDKVVKGKATLSILEAKTETIVLTKKITFIADANQSSALSFQVEGLKEGDYICEIIATDGSASDGERNRLPVLTTRVDVVENVPFYLDGASTKNVNLSAIFNKDSNTANDKHIEIGYTDNPALSVFKSLRALENPKHDNAPCYAAALYTNLVLLDMSKSLGNRIKDFDPKKAEEIANKAMAKLKKLQLSSGAWSWFEGMQASYYITLSVAENLSHLQAYLNRHGEKCPSNINDMLRKALKYLDKEELKDYRHRKKGKWSTFSSSNEGKSLRPTDSDLRYLAIATDPDKEMLNRYLDETVKDFKNLTIFGRSESVLILKKYGREKEARKFLESVKEYTLYKEGFGRYFATDLAYYSWMDYRIPTQLAAMRAIQRNEPTDNMYMLQMQLWLLRQKQTQTWENPINALDIADFLLTTNPDVSLHEVTSPILVLDGTSIKQDSIYAVDYAHKLTVTKTSPGISWGHVRGTFNEEVTRLDSYSSSELTISRKIIRDGNKVIIRNILHADRDMDFVIVKSQHAASLEPLRTVSGYQMMGGRGCYLEVHDSYINFFFDRFTRGTTTIDMEYYIARPGEYNTGYATIECSYAPEFGAHTSSETLK